MTASAELPRWVRPATVWLVLGLAVFVAVQAWQARRDALRFVVVDAMTVELHRGADGHYRWPGTVQGRPVDFLVDTGATSTAIPLALARALALPMLGAVTSQTAGGPVRGSSTVADVVLDGGVRAERLRLTALPGLTEPLLGMDVLGRLRLEQSHGVLRLQRPPPAR